MKLKRVLAFVMTASLLVSTPMMDTEHLFAQEAVNVEETETGESVNATEVVGTTETTEESGTTEKSEMTEDAEATETTEVVNIDETTGHSGDVENAEIWFPEDKNLTPIEELQEDTGVQAGEDTRPMENKTAVPAETTEVQEENVSIEQIDRSEIDMDFTVDGDKKAEVSEFLNEATVKEEDMVDVIIVMDGDSIVEDDNDASMNFWNKIKTSLMEKKQDTVVSRIEKKVLGGDELEVRYNYTWLLNGIATTVPFGMIDDIEAVNGVESVILQPVYEVCDTEEIMPYTVADEGMIGRDDTWQAGYTGKGIKIAVLDTGIDANHQNFQAMGEDCLTADSETEAKIAAVIDQLNASRDYAGLKASHVYRSNKIAYGFNYSDANLRIDHDGDKQGDHGTHVAGIAAANDLKNGKAVGVAPDAQLYIMKVFGATQGASTEVLLAAIEDALILEADVINMSLGSPAGFTSGGAELDEIYGRVSKTNTVLAVAAGNSTTSSVGNMWGTDKNLASNPDNSIISSPATYTSATSVASVDNVGVMGYYVEAEGRKFSYSDGVDGVQDAFVTLGGKELEFAMVENCGQSMEDFFTADVYGKIAVVQRGVTAFTEKAQFAQDAGAVACLIYNNTAGTIGMNLAESNFRIPTASITMKAGEYLAAVKAENPQAKLYVSDEESVTESETAYRMSDFSSWGISPDLSLEPDVTAPGGNIYSTLNHGKYGQMSGTSMASPNMAGVAAVVMQYAKEKYPKLSAAELHTFVNALIMSTAEPLSYNDELLFSPRNQGAGLVNAYNAIRTGAYLSVDGVDTPKAELGDDPAKTGSYTYDFKVTNISSESQYYDMNTVSQTEGVLEEYGKLFMSETPTALPAATAESSANMVGVYDYNENGATDTVDARQLYLKVSDGSAAEAADAFRYDFNKDEEKNAADVQNYLDKLVGKEVAGADLSETVLKVAPGETATVTVDVNVAAEGKNYMDSNFANGIYVEGYTMLTARNAGGMNLSLPYLGFYGDWTQAPMIDSGYYWDEEETMEASQYINFLFTNYKEDVYNTWLPGLNPYDGMNFNLEKMSLSPNDDGFLDYIDDIYVSLLRNAKNLTIAYEDAETGAVYFQQDFMNIQKSYLIQNAGQIIPFATSMYTPDVYRLVDEAGEFLPNNTKLNLKITATVDYPKHDQKNLVDTWEIPMTVDTEAPEIVSAKVTTEEGRKYLELTYRDNVGAAGIVILNRSQSVMLDQMSVEPVAAGEEATQKLDITGCGNEFTVVVGDYAVNEAAYVVRTEDNDPEVADNLIYGYRSRDSEYNDDSVYGWVGIDTANGAETTVLSSEYYVDYAIVAAEYVDGHILAVDSNQELCSIEPGYWDERHKITNLGITVRDMTYDPVTKSIYMEDNMGQLYQVDILTGEKTAVGMPIMNRDWWIRTMACDDNGILYTINEMGELRVMDKTTGELGEVLAETHEVTGSRYLDYAQSMLYDSNDKCLYWAGYTFSWTTGDKGVLYKIDTENGYTVTETGVIAGNAEVVGLLKMDAKGCTLPEAEVKGLSFEEPVRSMLKWDEKTLDVMVTPWYAKETKLTWNSSDAESVEVSPYGLVTAKKAGTATITATAENGVSTECTIHVVEPQAKLTGFVVESASLQNQWLDFAVNNLRAAEPLTNADFRTYTAAECVDGTIYAYSEASEFYRMDAEKKAPEKISASSTDFMMLDMAYNYADGFLYGIKADYMTGMVSLVQIDMLTGKFDFVSDLTDGYGGGICGLAIATDGTMYAVSTMGFFGTIENGVFERIGLTGFTPNPSFQSMAYDHKTGGLYWSMLAAEGVGIMYLDTMTGSALPLGTIDGGALITGLYSVPETVPERPEVAVESAVLASTEMKMLEGAKQMIPMEIRPFNATDRKVTWEVADENVASITNGIVTAEGVGTTTAVGTVGEFTLSLEITVVPSAGTLRGYILTDYATMGGDFWGEFHDNDLMSGNGLQDANGYTVYAGEYYNGKVYAYGRNKDTYEAQFMIFNAADFTLEQTIVAEYPDVKDMTFDYTEGVMYAVAGIRNTEGNTKLYMVDITNGNLFEVAEFTSDIQTIAADANGILYGLNGSGILYQIDKTTAALTVKGETGYQANQYQSMAFDHNTGNLYWAQVFNDSWTFTFMSYLLMVDPEDASCMNLGQIGLAGSEIVAMHTIPKNEIAHTTPEVRGVLLNQSSALLKPGDTTQLAANALPISVFRDGMQVVYESDNTAVAAVDENGLVTATGAGRANITATIDGKASAVCVVDVVGDDVLLYSMNQNGWQTSPLLRPDTITDSVNLPVDCGLAIKEAVYNTVDGYFYAIGEDGYLWKFTMDMGLIEKIGNDTVLNQLSNYGEFGHGYIEPEIVDLKANPVTGKVYVMANGLVSVHDEMWGGTFDMNLFYLYEVDTTTGAGTMVVEIPLTVERPDAFTFMNENEVIVYDAYRDNIFALSMDDAEGTVRKLAWVQDKMTSGDYLGMIYSAAYGKLFLATADGERNNGRMALYLFDLSTNSLTKYSDAVYDTMRDIVLMEGVEPAVGLVDELDEEVEAEDAETENVEAGNVETGDVGTKDVETENADVVDAGNAEMVENAKDAEDAAAENAETAESAEKTELETEVVENSEAVEDAVDIKDAVDTKDTAVVENTEVAEIAEN